MSLSPDILQNKWLASVLAHVQSVLQAFLLALIVVCLGVAWWRYQSTVFLISKVRIGNDHLPNSSGDMLSSYVRPVSFYTDLVSKRDIFRFSSVDNSSVVTVSADMASRANQDLSSRFIIQGIVLDHHPMAIIKDIQSNKTYFLHRSEMLEEAQLIDIYDNRVTFHRGEETLELIKK